MSTGSDAKVVRSLQAIDLTAWCPTVDRVVTQGRKVVFKGERPFLPGYVFVAMPSMMPGIVATSATGAMGFLKDRDGAPIIVPQRVIDALARPVEPVRNAPKAGERIQIARGPLAGFFGAVERACPATVRVVVEMFQQSVFVNVPLDAVA